MPPIEFKSNKVRDLLISKYKTRTPTSEIILININPDFNCFLRQMQSREFSAKEVATMILNEDDPKTMDYFFTKLLGVKLQSARVDYAGRVSGSLVSTKTRITEAVSMLGRITSKMMDKGQVYFVLDIHEEQGFPKSRSFKICSKRSMPVDIVNPRAGYKKKILYTSGYTAEYQEAPSITIPKHLVLYCRNSWDRRSELKPSKAKK